jgi:lipoprotein-anchoring transpeptidase ErfK/SrfK
MNGGYTRDGKPGQTMKQNHLEQENPPRASRTALTRRGLLALTAGAVAAAGTPALASPFVAPGVRAEHVIVGKTSRILYLMRDNVAFKTYRVALGFEPRGHKTRSGDGRTPEGVYWIDRRNPRSEFFLSLGISYPNAADVARARALGVSPGNNIMIHGEPSRGRRPPGPDWTAGCIAVSNAEMEEIWSIVPTGTQISILA